MEIIVAVDKNWGIGKDNKLLAHLPTDMKRFKRITSGNIVVMGRKTFESLGKPLPNRLNIVLTRGLYKSYDNVLFINDVNTLLELAKFTDKKIFVIGGAEIYKTLLDYCDKTYITIMNKTFDSDAYFPNLYLHKDWQIQNIDKKTICENGVEYNFITFIKRN